MRRRMGAIYHGEPGLSFQSSKGLQNHGIVIEEIEGLIKLYKDGQVERPPVIPDVPCTWSPEPDVTSRDLIINQVTCVWARFYVPKRQGPMPLLVYFHGGGFCVGSASWSCYHEFLARLASRASCVIMSVNYRLAPENRLPAAYEDGLTAIKWVRQQASRGSSELSWFSSHCNFSRMFIGGDSAGASIAYYVATQLGSLGVGLSGVILIQPFFSGEARTSSEKKLVQSPKSALSLATSDCYWRLALPPGTNRDHQWCNPLAKGSPKLEDSRLPPTLVCISELDILRDRNLEFCKAMKRAGKSVEHVIYAGVGHAFQVLHNSHMSQARTSEMIAQIKAFVNR